MIYQAAWEIFPNRLGIFPSRLGNRWERTQNHKFLKNKKEQFLRILHVGSTRGQLCPPRFLGPYMDTGFCSLEMMDL